MLPRLLIPPSMDLTTPPGEAVHALDGTTMGTTWHVCLAGPAQMDLAAPRARIERVLSGVIAQMSHWEPGSNLSRYNRAEPGSRHPLPMDFREVLRGALQVAQRSGGAFDPTSARLVNAWGFGPTGRHDSPGFTLPRPAELAALPLGWERLDIDAQGLLQPGGLTLDLSAIAKGFAVDAVAAELQAHGLAHHLVEIGGELRGRGIKPDGQPWWVSIEPPAPDCGLPPTRVALHGLAIATSGDYRRRYQHEGRSHAHTIDPRTRAPVTHGLASVSVLHTSCMLADAWSTALMVLGPQEALARADAEGLAAVLVWRLPRGGWAEGLSRAAQALCD